MVDSQIPTALFNDLQAEQESHESIRKFQRGKLERKGVPADGSYFQGRTDNINIRYAAGTGLLLNVFIVVVAIAAIPITVPKSGIKNDTQRVTLTFTF